MELFLENLFKKVLFQKEVSLKRFFAIRELSLIVLCRPISDLIRKPAVSILQHCQFWSLIY